MFSKVGELRRGYQDPLTWSARPGFSHRVSKHGVKDNTALGHKWRSHTVATCNKTSGNWIKGSGYVATVQEDATRLFVLAKSLSVAALENGSQK